MEQLSLELEPRLLTGDMDVLFGAVAAGLGIGLVPAFLCVEALRAGRVERVLRNWQAPPTPMHVVYPTTRHLSPKVKTFVDYLQQRMTPPPWELGPMP
jgi:DNA-binding transcriptional LysR family regulator